MKYLSLLIFLLLVFPQWCIYSQWITQNSNTNYHLWGVYFVSDNIGWAVGDSPIRKTEDGGTTWTSQWSGISSSLQDISFFNTTNGWISGDAGTILSTTNGGSTWIKDTSGITNKLSGIKAISQFRAIAVGNDGKILLKRNQFSNWVQISSGVTTTLHCVAFANQKNGCIVGENGVVLLTTDSGETWSKKNIGFTLPLNGVAYADINNILIVGSNGLVLKSTNGGNTWSTIILAGEPVLACVSYPTVAKAYISGHKYIFTTKDSCKIFERKSSGTDWLLASSFPSEDIGYLVGHGGKILKTNSGGQIGINISKMPTTYCKGQTFNLTYDLIGQYNSTNTFIAQLSDTSGSFDKPTKIGEIKTSSIGNISCSIPVNISQGNTYRVRIVSTSPIVNSKDNGTDITINDLPNPVINGPTSVCLGTKEVIYKVDSIQKNKYLWSLLGKGKIIGSTNSSSVNILLNEPGVDTLVISETNLMTGCTKDTSIEVDIVSPPVPIISGDRSVFENERGVVYAVKYENGSTYEWKLISGDAKISSVSGHLVVLNIGKVGSIVLGVKEINRAGCEIQTEISISVKSLSGISEKETLPFSTSPNPIGGTDQFLVRFAEIPNQDISIELLDILGSIHYSNTIQAGSESCTIPVQGLSSGMYMLRVRMNNEVFIEKVIVN